MKNLLLPFFLFLAVACNENKPAQEENAKQLPVAGSIERLSPELDNIIAPDAEIEILAEGFDWSEGPLWVPQGEFLIFSDVPQNKIFKWKEGEGASVYLAPSGYAASSKELAVLPKEAGSNGLVLDAEGRLVLCQHGDRRMARINAPLDQPKPDFITLADKWNGKRFNSPNDAAYDSKGNLWFTDPPYGLPQQAEDPAREIPFQGVYRLRPNGTVDLMIDSLSKPNGIALSPDEKTLYVANSDPAHAVWMTYEIMEDGSLANGRIFYDATDMVGEEHKGLPDGLKVSKDGILFATGPGGCWIFKPDGTVLGRINTGQATANCAFGNDGKALYLTADMYLMRLWLK